MTAEAEIYDSASGAWAAVVPLPRPRVGGSGVLLPDGSVVVVGGDEAFGSAEDTPSCPVPTGSLAVRARNLNFEQTPGR